MRYAFRKPGERGSVPSAGHSKRDPDNRKEGGGQEKKEENKVETGRFIAMMCMAVLTAADIKEKKIPVLYVLLFGMMACAYRIAAGGEWMSVLYASIPGIFLLMVSFCTKESIGYGDGWSVLALGLFVGAEGCLAAVGIGLLLSALVSLVLLMLRKVNGKSRLPFLPFLTIGLGGWMIVQKGL